MAQQEPVATRRSRGRLGTVVTALLAGIAGGLMAPMLLPRLERNIRPAAKSVFKSGIALYERGRERAAELGEMAGDMLAEARAEYDAEQSAPQAGSDPVAADPVAANEIVRLRRAAGKEAGSPHG